MWVDQVKNKRLGEMVIMIGTIEEKVDQVLEN